MLLLVCFWEITTSRILSRIKIKHDRKEVSKDGIWDARRTKKKRYQNNCTPFSSMKFLLLVEFPWLKELIGPTP